jgi:DNA-binding transcriptional ArsR family regulator
MRDWVRLPSGWIEERGLRELQWTRSETTGSDNAAALMVLAPIAHHADEEGLAKCTYDLLSLATGLSRSKVSAGLSVLQERAIIDREPNGRSTFLLKDYKLDGGWSKFPARRLYSGGRILAFDHFKLRTMTELHALKLYYLFARRRSSRTNMAHLSYEKIEAYADIERERIRRAISFLVSVGLVHVERTESTLNERGTANAYRLAFLDPYVHFGTRGRQPDFARADDEFDVFAAE